MRLRHLPSLPFLLAPLLVPLLALAAPDEAALGQATGYPAATEMPFTYRYQGRPLTLHDYMQHQRATGLLGMASGARYVEDYTPNDDRARFNATSRRAGIAQAVHEITERSDPPGQRFNYAGAQTEVLGLVLRGIVAAYGDG